MDQSTPASTRQTASAPVDWSEQAEAFIARGEARIRTAIHDLLNAPVAEGETPPDVEARITAACTATIRHFLEDHPLGAGAMAGAGDAAAPANDVSQYLASLSKAIDDLKDATAESVRAKDLVPFANRLDALEAKISVAPPPADVPAATTKKT